MLQIELMSGLDHDQLLKRRIEKNFTKNLEHLPKDANILLRLKRVRGKRKQYKSTMSTFVNGRKFYFEEFGASPFKLTNEILNSTLRAIEEHNRISRTYRRSGDIIVRKSVNERNLL